MGSVLLDQTPVGRSSPPPPPHTLRGFALLTSQCADTKISQKDVANKAPCPDHNDVGQIVCVLVSQQQSYAKKTFFPTDLLLRRLASDTWGTHKLTCCRIRTDILCSDRRRHQSSRDRQISPLGRRPCHLWTRPDQSNRFVSTGRSSLKSNSRSKQDRKNGLASALQLVGSAMGQPRPF